MEYPKVKTQPKWKFWCARIFGKKLSKRWFMWRGSIWVMSDGEYTPQTNKADKGE